MLLSERPPEAQLGVLTRALNGSRSVLSVYDDYYHGAVPFHLTEAKYAEVYRRLQRESRPKWAKLIIMAAAQRLAVEGFLTDGGTEPDQALWRNFVLNGLDAAQHEVHLDATLFGRAYVSCWPSLDGSVRCIPESPYEVIHWRSPDRSHMIALKLWAEEDVWRARLYTPFDIYAWASPRKSMESQIDVGLSADLIARGDRPMTVRNGDTVAPTNWVEDGPPMPNPFAPLLPIVPFVAGSRGDTLGRSDIEPALDILDRIMALQLDLLLVSKVMGFPVRWATGIEVPEDGKGQQPMTTAIERFLTTENPDAKFGQLPAADLRQINAVISSVVTELAATTETPSSVLATANLANPVSAEALRAQEIPLVHRVRRHQRAFGPAWVHVARLVAGTFEGDVEVLWADAEVHSEAALTDALVKQVVSLQVPREAAWEQLPDTTPATVARWRTMRASQMIEDRLSASLEQAALAPPAAPTPPPAEVEPEEEVPVGGA